MEVRSVCESFDALTTSPLFRTFGATASARPSGLLEADTIHAREAGQAAWLSSDGRVLGGRHQRFGQFNI